MKQRALVTGANRGIGAAIAEKLSEDGFIVFGTSTNGSGTTKGVAEWLLADFTSQKGINNFLSSLERLESFDVLINNAGINIIKSQDEVSTEDYNRIENINLKAPYHIAKSLTTKMAEKGYGRIVHIASIWSVVSKPHRSLYSTMKTGLIGLTRATAAEWATKNVLINSVSPGFVETALTKASLNEEQQKNIVEQIPMQRFAKPSEIADVVAFLCSSKNTYLTGQNIIIDGGFTIV